MKKMMIIAVLTVIAAACLCGCSVGFINGSSVKYDNADKYTAGDREITDKIDRLDIDWVSGKVTVSADSGSSVRVTETTEADLDDKLKVHTWAEGSTLHVRFCKSGERYELEEVKSLEITVPEDTVFKSIDVDTSSADVFCDGITAENAVMDASSGNMMYNGDADSFKADTSSGGIGFSGSAEKISTNSSSGNVSITQTGSADSISVDTSSGDMDIDCEYTKKLQADSSSGGKVIRLAQMPEETTLDSSSGDVELYLPEDAGFTAEISTSSGDVEYELPLEKSGEDTYVCANGEAGLSISTSSGNVKIMKN